MHARPAADGARLGRLHGERTAAQVENDNFIADAVHLAERPMRERIHLDPDMICRFHI